MQKENSPVLVCAKKSPNWKLKLDTDDLKLISWHLNLHKYIRKWDTGERSLREWASEKGRNESQEIKIKGNKVNCYTPEKSKIQLTSFGRNTEGQLAFFPHLAKSLVTLLT